MIGTHALVQEGVAFEDLSLAVVDEQHRFGLHQRMALTGKGGGDIDVLIMTATPIPRTLALTYYGDLDVAILDELPPGRQPIATVAARTDGERADAEQLVRDEAAAGRQAFVVCAAIDEGNRTQVKAAETEAERLRVDVFPDLRVELLHGRMRPKDKERIMDAFRVGAADVLISTTVIEVGVDVPNATVMLVENAERFGLAQLHQLRGRIGRGAHPSTCVLFDASEPDNEEARARIDAMVRTTDGFELADEDLRLRGEGTLFDTRQSGMPDLKLARLAEDVDLIGRARARAFDMMAEDPGLAEHPELLGGARPALRRIDRLAVPLLRGPGDGLGSPVVRIIAGLAKGTRLGPVPPGHPPNVRHGAGRAVRQPWRRRGGGQVPRPVRGHGGGRDRGVVPGRHRGGVRRTLHARRRGDPRQPCPRAPVRGGRRSSGPRSRPWLGKHAAAQGLFDLVVCDPPYEVAGEPSGARAGRAGCRMACPGDVDRYGDPRS